MRGGFREKESNLCSHWIGLLSVFICVHLWLKNNVGMGFGVGSKEEAYATL